MSTQNDHTGPTAAHSVLRRVLDRKLTWLLVLPLVLVLLGYGGMYAFVQYQNAKAPAPLSFDDAPDPGGAPDTPPTTSAPAPRGASKAASPAALTPAAAAAAPAAKAGAGSVAKKAAPAVTKAPSTQQPGAAGSEVEGRWLVASSSLAGYRIGYSTAGVRGTRVGRSADGSKAVSGEFLISGTVLEAAKFAVVMAKVECDGGQQCTDHVNEMMDVAHHPNETFTLTKAVDLGSIPADGKQITVKVTGNLTLRGVTRSVTFPLTARRHDGRIEVLGSIPVNRDDYKIPDPSEPGFSIDKDGTIELLLVFDHA